MASAAPQPTAPPTAAPNPIWAAANAIQPPTPRLPSRMFPSAPTQAMKNSTAGSARPSLRPLSTLVACWTRGGTEASVITGWESAASVGASTAASSAASNTVTSGNSSTPTSVPAAMVSGIPMPSVRSGSEW